MFGKSLNTSLEEVWIMSICNENNVLFYLQKLDDLKWKPCAKTLVVSDTFSK